MYRLAGDKRLSTRPVILASLALALVGPSGSAKAAEGVSTASVAPVQQFLEKSCLACHSSSLQVADVDLQVISAGTIADDVGLWEKVAHKIRTGEMPPKGFPRPEESEAAAISTWIAAELERIEQIAPPDPGRVTARRLNRNEYNNTIRDLLGVDVRTADDFPQDDSGYGFDNIGDVLSLSPVLLEKYLAAAERVVDIALFGYKPPKPMLVRYQPPYRDYPLSETPLFDYDETGLSLPGALHQTHRFPVDGEYLIRVVPEGRRPNASEPIEMGFWLDGKLVKTLEVDAPSDIRSLDLFGQAREFRMRVPAGEHWIAGSVLKLFEGLPPEYKGPNPSKRPPPPPRVFEPPTNATAEELKVFKERVARYRRRVAGGKIRRTPANRVYIHYIEISGPFDAKAGPAPESLASILTCGHEHGSHIDSCSRIIVGNLAQRAFRRAVTDAELNPYLGLFREAKAAGASFEESVGTSALTFNGHVKNTTNVWYLAFSSIIYLTCELKFQMSCTQDM